MNRLNISIALGHIRQMNFCFFVEKNRRGPQIQRKNSCWVVGGHTKEVSYLLKLGSYPIFYEITVFSIEKIYIRYRRSKF